MSCVATPTAVQLIVGRRSCQGGNYDDDEMSVSPSLVEETGAPTHAEETTDLRQVTDTFTHMDHALCRTQAAVVRRQVIYVMKETP